MEFKDLDPPTSGTRISRDEQGLVVPDDPIIPFIKGDGIGPDIWEATRPVLDAAVEVAFGGQREIHWFEVHAGAPAHERFRSSLPQETVEAIRYFRVGMKGPLASPAEGGPNLNFALRQVLDLYAGVRPIRWLEGVPCPVKDPEKVDIVLFRQSTEGVYGGIGWSAESEEAARLVRYLNKDFEVDIKDGSALGLKLASALGSRRLLRRALQYTVDMGRSSMTLVHGGSIMPHTEGAFRDWGYELARADFADTAITEAELWEKYEGDRPDNKFVVKDRDAESMFQQTLLRPADYSVVATTNLNGDYLSGALAAQVGGLALAPGAILGDEAALFETSHGAVLKHADKDKANPGALISAGVMMLDHLGWPEAGRLITDALQETIRQKRVTSDLERHMSDATRLSCSEFGQAIIENMGR